HHPPRPTGVGGRGLTYASLFSSAAVVFCPFPVLDGALFDCFSLWFPFFIPQEKRGLGLTFLGPHLGSQAIFSPLDSCFLSELPKSTQELVPLLGGFHSDTPHFLSCKPIRFFRKRDPISFRIGLSGALFKPFLLFIPKRLPPDPRLDCLLCLRSLPL